MGRSIRVVLLSLLLSALAFIAYSRGFGWRLGAAPGAIHGQYQSEEAWIVTEVGRDIVEMSAYGGGRPADDSDIRPLRVSDGVYRFPARGPLRTTVDVHLEQDLWNPDAFAAIARGSFDQGPVVVPTPAAAQAVHGALLDLTPESLLKASESTSTALAANMRDARAHEAAALTLAAFALREAAKDFSDIRWSLNRMTAHLAMARAIRRDERPGIDGAIAEAALLTLTNHQLRAEAEIEQLKTSGDPSVDAWARALRLRLTQDWTAVAPSPQWSLLEKQEYFRARRATTARRTADGDLDRLGLPLGAEPLRIMQAYSVGVEDKGIATDNVLAAEWQETQTVFARLHDRPLRTELAADLNARAGRCVEGGKVQVLPWGAWAGFFQRHLAMQIVHLDRYYRNSLGIDSAADAVSRELRDEFRKLTLFPVATAYWTKGPRGGEADLTFINEAIDVASSTPELVTSRPWYFLEGGANYEAVRRGMPPGATWFVPLAPRAPYDAGWRVQYFSRPPTPADMQALMREAPHDVPLAIFYARVQYGDRPPPGELRRLFGKALEYDMRAVDFVRSRPTDDAERLAMAESACRISDSECGGLAAELVLAGREDEAAVQYEKVFADPDLDVVMMSNQSGWLVDYYYRHKKTALAVALAQRSEDTGSFRGLMTAAYLSERLGQLQSAEAMYRRGADRYQNQSPLLGFYYRQRAHGRTDFTVAWNALLPMVFPEGLRPVPAVQSTTPAHGVVVTKDNDRVRKAGLQAGDIIVGLEGWRVENLPQYYAVNTFLETEQMTLTVWRGKLFEVMLTAPNRLMGIEFRSYPIQGFSE